MVENRRMVMGDPFSSTLAARVRAFSENIGAAARHEAPMTPPPPPEAAIVVVATPADVVVVSVTPEPASMMMLGAGMIGLAAAGRRKQRAA